MEIHPRIISVAFKPQIDSTIVEDVLTNGIKIRVPDPNTNSLLLLSHAAGHFMSPGIGYRFLCDWAAFLQHNHERINRAIVLKEAKRMGMLNFVVEFTKLAEQELGLSFAGLEQWTVGSKEKYRLRLGNKLLEQGDFGAVNFQDNFKGGKLELFFHLLKSLLDCRYYWPRLFWRRIPRFLYRMFLGHFFVQKNSK